jgi:hypothetical protein
MATAKKAASAAPLNSKAPPAPPFTNNFIAHEKIRQKRKLM